MDTGDIVSFDWELALIKDYLRLEELRYRGCFRMEYDLEVTDFQLPPCTVQPLVENAVTHGAGMLPSGGRILLRTREAADGYEITVTDNGKGLSDPGQADTAAHKSVGIQNTRDRLRLMVGGELDVSFSESGTTARIFVPKKSRKI